MNNKDAEDAAKDEFKRKLNPIDGLLHNDDGTVTDPQTGTTVEPAGFNKKHHKKDLKTAPVLAHNNSTKSTLAQKSKSHKKSAKSAHKHHKKNKKDKAGVKEEDSQAEVDQKAKDTAAIKAEAESNEKAIAAKEAADAKKAKEEADFKEKYSAIDGLLHNKDGSKVDPTDGRVIGGANVIAQVGATHGHHNKHHAVHAKKHHHKSAKKAHAEKEELAQEFEKKEHDAKGFATWLEKDEPESEEAVQHHKHKAHHQKAA